MLFITNAFVVQNVSITRRVSLRVDKEESKSVFVSHIVPSTRDTIVRLHWKASGHSEVGMFGET